MSMTKKDYELVARAIKDMHTSTNVLTERERSLLTMLSENLALKFGVDNPGFARHLFLDACGL